VPTAPTTIPQDELKCSLTLAQPDNLPHIGLVNAEKTRLLNFYLPGGFEKVIMEFGVPAKSRTLPPPNLKARAPLNR
jgi:hypothetical protein